MSNESLVFTMPLDPALTLTTDSFSFSAALRCTTWKLLRAAEKSFINRSFLNFCCLCHNRNNTEELSHSDVLILGPCWKIQLLRYSMQTVWPVQNYQPCCCVMAGISHLKTDDRTSFKQLYKSPLEPALLQLQGVVLHFSLYPLQMFIKVTEAKLNRHKRCFVTLEKSLCSLTN